MILKQRKRVLILQKKMLSRSLHFTISIETQLHHLINRISQWPSIRASIDNLMLQTSTDTNITPTLSPKNGKLEQSTHYQSNEKLEESTHINSLDLNQTSQSIHTEDECRLYDNDKTFNCGIIATLYKYVQVLKCTN